MEEHQYNLVIPELANLSPTRQLAYDHLADLALCRGVIDTGYGYERVSDPSSGQMLHDANTLLYTDPRSPGAADSRVVPQSTASRSDMRTRGSEDGTRDVESVTYTFLQVSRPTSVEIKTVG